jgi:hypothetical protein
MTEPKMIERSGHQARGWLDALAAELGTDDRAYAHRVLRAHSSSIRRSWLTPDPAVP